jgi:hypothetical protein
MLQITSSGHKKVMSWGFMKLIVSNFDYKLRTFDEFEFGYLKMIGVDMYRKVVS